MLLDASVKSALVVLLAFLLDLAFKVIGLVVDQAVLYSIAAAIVAWLLGDAIGAHVANGIRYSFMKR